MAAVEILRSALQRARVASLLTLVSVSCASCGLFDFEPSAEECGSPRTYEEDARLPGVGTTARALTERFEMEQTLQIRFPGSAVPQSGFKFPAFPARQGELLTVSIDDDGRPFVVPWEITSDGVCYELDPTKAVHVRLRSTSGDIAADARAKLSIDDSGLILAFSMDEQPEALQGYVAKLPRKPNMSTEWRFEMRFDSAGNITTFALKLSVTGEEEGGTTHYGTMTAAAH